SLFWFLFLLAFFSFSSALLISFIKTHKVLNIYLISINKTKKREMSDDVSAIIHFSFFIRFSVLLSTIRCAIVITSIECQGQFKIVGIWQSKNVGFGQFN